MSRKKPAALGAAYKSIQRNGLAVKRALQPGVGKLFRSRRQPPRIRSNSTECRGLFVTAGTIEPQHDHGVEFFLPAHLSRDNPEPAKAYAYYDAEQYQESDKQADIDEQLSHPLDRVDRRRLNRGKIGVVVD